MRKSLSKTQYRILVIATQHPRGSIVAGTRRLGIQSAAETAVIEALERRGFVEWDGLAPRVNDAGRAAVNQIFREQDEALGVADQCRREEDERVL